MAISSDELNAFHRFAIAQVAISGAESLHELVTLWESTHQDASARAQNVAAVQAAIRDMQNGDRGRPAVELLEELRADLASRPSK
jgi:hypothetical protein